MRAQLTTDHYKRISENFPSIPERPILLDASTRVEIVRELLDEVLELSVSLGVSIWVNHASPEPDALVKEDLSYGINSLEPKWAIAIEDSMVIKKCMTSFLVKMAIPDKAISALIDHGRMGIDAILRSLTTGMSEDEKGQLRNLLLPSNTEEEYAEDDDWSHGDGPIDISNSGIDQGE